MSARHRKNRGITSQPIKAQGLRPRYSRHGRIMVGNPPKSFDDERPSPYVATIYEHKKSARQIKMVDGVVTVIPAQDLLVPVGTRPMTALEVQAERAKVRRACGPTTNYGQTNKPDLMAPRGKPGSAPDKHGRKK